MCPPAFPPRGKRPQKGDNIECEGDNIECCAVQQQADAAHRSTRRGGGGEGTSSTKCTALLARKPTAFVLVRRFLRMALYWQWGGSMKEVHAAVKPWEMACRMFRWDAVMLPNIAARRAVCR